MGEFTPEWLALREPADVAARSEDLARFVSRALDARDCVRVVDLGSGTGSNVRYLSRLLPARQAWTLVDHDARLLDAARRNVPVPAVTSMQDIRALDAHVLQNADLVTASALLDIVTDECLDRLLSLCEREGAAVLMALNYNGELRCRPEDPDDDLVRRLFNLHQKTDWGAGVLLGPDAGRRAESWLREAGYSVLRAKSDWVLHPEQAELQRQLIAGWAGAAVEMSASDAARVRAWEARRFAHVNAGDSRLIVGHDDVGAVSHTSRRVFRPDD